MANRSNRSRVPTINLYGENGIAIYLSACHDVCERDEAVVRVVGRAIYDGSVERAEQSMRRAYLSQANIDDPLV